MARGRHEGGHLPDAAPAGGGGVAIRTLIIEDHTLFSDTIRPLLAGLGMEVLAVATRGQEGIEIALRERPDIVLVDLGLPDLGGLAVGTRILDALPETKVVALTGRNDAQAIDEAMAAGFAGYITKDTPMTRFQESVRAALDGRVVLPQPPRPQPEAARSPEERDAELLARQLTPREREVLALLVEGGDNVQIARRLGVSPNTVRTHVQSILTKLQVRSRLQAAAFAVRYELVEVGGERRYA